MPTTGSESEIAAPTHACSIVTGAGRGIGRAIAVRLARDGPVVAVGRTAADLEDVCRSIVAAGGRAEACVGDVADERSAGRAVAAADGRGWIVRHLVCNAGIGKGGPTDGFDPEQWRRIFDVNIHGAFYFVRACVPRMVAQGTGTLCLMSGLAGVKGIPFDAA